LRLSRQCLRGHYKINISICIDTIIEMVVGSALV
jgi:hypothetical protein